MNSFDFDHGMAVALHQRGQFTQGALNGFPESKRIQLRSFPTTLLSREDYFLSIAPDIFNARKQQLPTHWQHIAEHVRNGVFSDRIAYGLLRLMQVSHPQIQTCTPSRFIVEIAVHEIAAFAQTEPRRMQMRIKKNVPVHLFPVWESAQQKPINPEMAKLIRDAYLNLAAKSLAHVGLYLLVFSKVHTTIPAFEHFLNEFDNASRPVLRGFRKTTLRSSRKHLASALDARMAEICAKLEEEKTSHSGAHHE